MPLLEFDINIIDIIINYYTIDYRHIFKFLFLSKYINYKNIIKLSLQPNNTYDYKYYYFNISKIYNTLYKCINLRELSIYGQDNINYNYLLNIKYLKIPTTILINIKSISCLTYLSHLDISNTIITDITLLSNFNNLIILNCLGCINLYYIPCLKYIQVLNLRYTKISYIDNIIHNIYLSELDIGYTFIPNLVSIKTCINLIKLDLEQTNITDISDLLYLTKLEELNLSYLLITDISTLQYLINLTNLNLNYCSKLTNFNPIQFCHKLYLLYLKNTLITDISVLLSLTYLKKIFINEYDNNIINLNLLYNTNIELCDI